MKLSKKSISCIAVAALCIVLTVVAFNSDRQEIARHVQGGITAGITNAVIPSGEYDMAQVKALDKEVVGAQKDTSEDEEAQIDETIQKATATQQVDSKWEDRLMVNVDTSLNVRSKASEDSKIVGKMFPGSAANILKRDGDWVKIKSGNVKGYVKAEYCEFGEEAQKLAKKQGCYYAIAQSDGLRVRSKASTDSKIYTVVDKGSRFKLAKKESKSDDWVAISYKGERAFVSSEYVKTSLVLGKALTIKEYNEQLAEEEAEKQAAKEAAAARTSSVSTTQQASVAADVDDVTLLAALIQCEAGSQSYEGKLAVGAVVCNRIRSSRYPNTLRGVIYQSGQFGPAHNGALASRLGRSISSSCVRAAQEALGGADNVDGALHFQSTRTGRSGIVIGGHVFY
ncbi:MAG: SH3 domain-containing protein [Lachnospiraceae bacterium]